MIAYLDTSALVKLLINERESAPTWDAMRDAQRVFASRIIYPEGCAALAAAQRARRVRPSRQTRTRQWLDGFVADIQFVEPTQPLLWHAADLADHHVLTGADAIHLASALTVDPTCGSFPGTNGCVRPPARRGSTSSRPSRPRAPRARSAWGRSTTSPRPSGSPTA